jgi:hypothetical protein
VVLILNMIALMDRFTRGRADASGPRISGLLSGVVTANMGGGMHTSDTQAHGAAGGQS